MLIDDETLAKLLLSVGTRKKWRPLDPIETAKILDQLSKKHSQKKVASTLGVSSETIRQFISFLTLSEKVQKLVKDRKIGIDMGYRISLLKDKNEQDILSDAIIEKKLTSYEVRGIIQTLKKSNPEMDITECIDIAIKYRLIIEEEHIIITRISKEICDSVIKFSNIENLSPSELINNILVKEFNESDQILSTNLSDVTLIIVLTSDGFNLLNDTAKKLNLDINHIIDVFISKGIKKYESTS